MRNLCFGLLLIAFLLGCATEEGDERQAARNLEQKENGIVVDTMNDAEFEQLLRQRDGKLLFLNLWATWCVPCKEEFPDLVRLAEEYQTRPVEFVGLSIDYPDEIETKIEPFLKQMNVNFKIYVQDFSDQQKFINQLNPEWSGALPTTFIYDTDGNQRAFLVGRHSYQEFKQEIDRILAN